MKTFVDPTPREFSLSRLRLDPNNPRLKLHPGGNSEKEIIERLCKLGSQSPSQVVKHILTDRGYLHNEIPVILKEDGKSALIVVDGNRRVAALKMVLNHGFIPSTRRGLKADCEKLVDLVPDKIRCWVTHNKSDAKRIVYRAHNEGTREWETLSKYGTYYDYHKEGATIAEIVEITGLDPSNITKQLNTWILIESMIEHIPEFEIESSGITSFERVTTHYKDFPRKLGIGISEDGLYLIPPSENLIKLIYKIYLSSAKSQGLSRSVENNDASREAFLNGIIPSGFYPDLGDESGSEIANKTAETLKDNDPKEASSPTESHTDKQNSSTAEPVPSERQILSVKKNVGKKAFEIYKEFSSLSTQDKDFPIASAALTRAMIETTLKFHAKRLKCYHETPAQQSKRQSDLLDAVSEKLRQKIVTLNLPYSADLVASINNCCKAIPELNDVMHKDGSFAARPAVRTALSSLASAVENLTKITP